ncbi:interleukin-12 subunit alpha [Sorex fumeus]|uniref:interleukin-12 subunit alpha n=1 Tax=Sorex fumeus TaxID=62283 RepID=UPI0024ACF000|nr:interleukin-12 subunit alpha [Sorex fumeus]
MHPRSLLLLVATLVLLSPQDLLGLARSLPVTPKDGPAVTERLSRAQNLLEAVMASLQTARHTLSLYPCSPEETDHVDITREKTSTVQTCVPWELAAVWSPTRRQSDLRRLSGTGFRQTRNSICLPWEKDPLRMRALCLGNISKDLELYQLEFRTLNAKLLMDPQQQISVDQNLLGAIEGLMQALTLTGESEPEAPAVGEPDLYRAKVQLCVLLQAFHVRAVTIHRVMSHLAA